MYLKNFLSIQVPLFFNFYLTIILLLYTSYCNSVILYYSTLLLQSFWWLGSCSPSFYQLFDSHYYFLQLVDILQSSVIYLPQSFVPHSRSQLKCAKISENFHTHDSPVRAKSERFPPTKARSNARARLIIVSSFQKTSVRFPREFFRPRGKKESIDTLGRFAQIVYK